MSGGDQLGLHRVEPAHGSHRSDGQHNHHALLDHELNRVCHQHAPQPGERRDERGNHDHAYDIHQSLGLCDAEDHANDFHHGQVHPAQHEAADRDAEIERAEAAEECGRPARVTDLAELDVGHDAAPAPQPRVKEDGEHAAGQEIPPEPVAGDAAARHQSGDGQRRVGGKRCGHHGCPGQPPRHVATGEEVFRERRTGAAPVVEANAQVQGEVERDDDPV